MKIVGVIVALGLAAAAAEAPEPADAPPPSAKVERSALCTAIADREPVDPLTEPFEYETKVQRIYFWNAVRLLKAPQTLKHVWSRDGKIVTQVKLKLKYSRVRTWSSNTALRGAWRVQTLSPDGEVLATAEFTVR